MQCVENCFSFSITSLKNSGYLKSDKDLFNLSSHWIRNGEKEASIGFNLITLDEKLKLLTFYYSVDGRLIKYEVEIVAFPSNLGFGNRWYFICPATSKRCMSLIKPSYSDFFLHRTAFSLLYKQQLYNKDKFSRFFLLLDKIEKRDELIEELWMKYRKSNYRGIPTPLVKKIRTLSFKIDNLHP